MRCCRNITRRLGPSTFNDAGGRCSGLTNAETSYRRSRSLLRVRRAALRGAAQASIFSRAAAHFPVIKNASVEETKGALAKAGLTTEFMPIPLTVIVLKIGNKYVMVDAGSGVGQWQANATHLPANMNAAGIDRNQISTILVSHFHPDHVWGLMEKGTNAAVFPNAELIVNGSEYKRWTEPGRVREIGRRPQGRRQAHR